MNYLRLTVALALVLAAGVVAQGISRREAAAALPAGEGLIVPLVTGVPMDVGPWHGADAGPLDAATLATLGADRILNRSYRANGQAIGLYVAAYDRQRPSISIHSPLHCLPGTGWSVLTDDTLRPPLAGGSSGSVRRLVAVRDRARVLILYWYAIHGRMVASDALSRLYLLSDSVRLGRNDAALVRLVVPVADDDDERAEQQGLEFLRALAPYVGGPL